MRSASPKPWVVTSSVASPLRSSKALVATVVPIFTHSTCSGVTGSPALRPSKWRMPATAASRYCSGFSDKSLCVTKVPSGRLPTTSVKVPPRSIQNCQRVLPAGVMWDSLISRSTIRLKKQVHKEAAARAAWSYMPESTRSNRANSPMSRFSPSSALSASIRQLSLMSR